MCGVAGTLFAHPVAHDELRAIVTRMTGSLAHRGPDDDGVSIHADGRAALGSRRLAILDLSSAGHQPMTSASGRYTIVFNGAIYNHLDLRRELAGQVTFRGHSDTETIAAALDRWGVAACIPRLDGMFAIAIWDHEREELSLTRDRLGEKPLYLYRRPGLLAFASELRAFRQLPGFAVSVDPDALAAYLRYLYVPAPASIFLEIRKLLPGHILTVRDPSDADGGTAYWSAEGAAAAGQRTPWSGSDDEAAETLDALLRESVTRRMCADVPVGALLSGGVDSSLVVARMTASASGSVRTYAVSFPEADFDESTHSAAVARHFGTSHTTFAVSETDLVAAVPRLPELFDEPHADPSCVPTYLISALARRDVTVALTGDGGDELFGGYNRYSRGAPLLSVASLLPFELRRRLFAGAPGAHRSGLVHRLGGGGAQQTGHSRDGRVRRVLQERRASGMYEQMITTRSSVHDLVPASTLGPLLAARGLDDTGMSMAHRMMRFDQQVYLPDDLLAKLDRASMAVSLETRTPLLDHRIAEFSWRLPLRLKIRYGKSKWILRQLLPKGLPLGMFDRPKMGFSSPINAWLRGPLRPWADELLGDAGQPQSLLDPVSVRKVWRGFLDGDDDSALLVWALTVYRAWEQRWLGESTVIG